MTKPLKDLPDSVIEAGDRAYVKTLRSMDYAPGYGEEATEVFLAMAKALVKHDWEESQMTLGEWKARNVLAASRGGGDSVGATNADLEIDEIRAGIDRQFLGDPS